MKHETMEKLCSMVSDELTKVTNKVEKTELSTGMLEYIDKLAHTLKSIKTIMAMEDAGGSYDDGSYDDGSYRGSYRSYNPGYSRRRYNYSRDDKVVSELRDLMDKAPEDTKHEFQRLISKMESM